MTTRERFLAVMSLEKPDRIPYFEEGIRKDVIKAWKSQGLSSKSELSEMFSMDHFEEIAPELDPLPEFGHWPSTLGELKLLRARLKPEKSKRLPRGWKKRIRDSNKNNHVILHRVHRGLFLSLGVYKWDQFINVISLLIENPEFVHRVLAIQAAFAAKMLEITLKQTKIDAVIFSEPIGGTEGPLVSPNMYEQFVLKSFNPIFDVLEKHKISHRIIRTYANARVLIPKFLKYGINCIWACETNLDSMDYLDLRAEFGRELRLIGGIDLDALREGKEAIRHEIESKVPPLIDQGGYIPLADGRIRSDVSYENYVYYRQLLEKATKVV
jgi:uroporphyrinogen decarboxylase